MKQGPLYTVIYIFILAFVFVFILAAVNEVTKDRIAKNNVLSLRKGVLDAFGIGFKNEDEAFSEYDTLIKSETKDGRQFYTYKSKNDTFYAAQFQGNGLWGIITVVLAVDSKVSMIVGIGILSDIETAGLGGRIEEPAYKAQFRDEKIASDGKIKLTRTGRYDTDHENSSIDGITGATRTSESMRNIANDAIAWFRQHIGDAQ